MLSLEKKRNGQGQLKPPIVPGKKLVVRESVAEEHSQGGEKNDRMIEAPEKQTDLASAEKRESAPSEEGRSSSMSNLKDETTSSEAPKLSEGARKRLGIMKWPDSGPSVPGSCKKRRISWQMTTADGAESSKSSPKTPTDEGQDAPQHHVREQVHLVGEPREEQTPRVFEQHTQSATPVRVAGRETFPAHCPSDAEAANHSATVCAQPASCTDNQVVDMEISDGESEACSKIPSLKDAASKQSSCKVPEAAGNCGEKPPSRPVCEKQTSTPILHDHSRALKPDPSPDSVARPKLGESVPPKRTATTSTPTATTSPTATSPRSNAEKAAGKSRDTFTKGAVKSSAPASKFKEASPKFAVAKGSGGTNATQSKKSAVPSKPLERRPSATSTSLKTVHKSDRVSAAACRPTDRTLPACNKEPASKDSQTASKSAKATLSTPAGAPNPPVHNSPARSLHTTSSKMNQKPLEVGLNHVIKVTCGERKQVYCMLCRVRLTDSNHTGTPSHYRNYVKTTLPGLRMEGLDLPALVRTVRQLHDIEKNARTNLGVQKERVTADVYKELKILSEQEAIQRLEEILKQSNEQLSSPSHSSTNNTTEASAEQVVTSPRCTSSFEEILKRSNEQLSSPSHSSANNTTEALAEQVVTSPRRASSSEEILKRSNEQLSSPSHSSANDTKEASAEQVVTSPCRASSSEVIILDSSSEGEETEAEAEVSSQGSDVEIVDVTPPDTSSKARRASVIERPQRRRSDAELKTAHTKVEDAGRSSPGVVVDKDYFPPPGNSKAPANSGAGPAQHSNPEMYPRITIGELVPGSSYLSAWLSVKNLTCVIGLASVWECQAKSRETFFLCETCRETLSKKDVCKHIVSSKHESNYVKQVLASSSTDFLPGAKEDIVKVIAQQEHSAGKDAQVIFMVQELYEWVETAPFSEALEKVHEIKRLKKLTDSLRPRDPTLQSKDAQPEDRQDQVQVPGPPPQVYSFHSSENETKPKFKKHELDETGKLGDADATRRRPPEATCVCPLADAADPWSIGTRVCPPPPCQTFTDVSTLTAPCTSWGQTQPNWCESDVKTAHLDGPGPSGAADERLRDTDLRLPDPLQTLMPRRPIMPDSTTSDEDVGSSKRGVSAASFVPPNQKESDLHRGQLAADGSEEAAVAKRRDSPTEEIATQTEHGKNRWDSRCQHVKATVKRRLSSSSPPQGEWPAAPADMFPPQGDSARDSVGCKREADTSMSCQWPIQVIIGSNPGPAQQQPTAPPTPTFPPASGSCAPLSYTGYARDGQLGFPFTEAAPNCATPDGPPPLTRSHSCGVAYPGQGYPEQDADQFTIIHFGRNLATLQRWWPSLQFVERLQPQVVQQQILQPQLVREQQEVLHSQQQQQQQQQQILQPQLAQQQQIFPPQLLQQQQQIFPPQMVHQQIFPPQLGPQQIFPPQLLQQQIFPPQQQQQIPTPPIQQPYPIQLKPEQQQQQQFCQWATAAQPPGDAGGYHVASSGSAPFPEPANQIHSFLHISEHSSHKMSPALSSNNVM